jgi:hypothetical protein
MWHYIYVDKKKKPEDLAQAIVNKKLNSAKVMNEVPTMIKTILSSNIVRVVKLNNKQEEIAKKNWKITKEMPILVKITEEKELILPYFGLNEIFIEDPDVDIYS